MKYIINIFLVSTFILMAACNKKLTVLPQNDITTDQIKTGSDVVAVLGGAYQLLQNGNAFGENYFDMADLLASQDQVNFVGTFTEYKQFQTKTLLSNNGEVTGMWEEAYDIINTANVVINKAYLTGADSSATIGEAEFIRSLIYFELVNFYSKPYSAGNTTMNLGVPILTAPTYVLDTTSNYYVARLSVETVYQQVLKDLLDAASKLPETNGERANKYSAEAILSRVYMSMGNYAQAATMANDIITSKEFSLTPQYSGAFNNVTNSSEDIFAIQQSAQSNTGTSNNGLTTFYAPTYPDVDGASSGRGDIQIDKGYFSYFGSGDFRASYVYTGTSIAGHRGTYPEKWWQFYKTIPVVRLAEIYLTRGEANLKAGTAVGSTPLKDINIVRTRSNASPLSSVTESDFIDERFRELGFEGDRVWTLKRNKLPVDGFAFDSSVLVLPIPLREIQVNKNLVQNSGY